MAFKNFKVETDADGIAVVTWDIPGRSMNVLDTTTIEELGAIVDQTTADAAVKGVVITSGKDAFSAGADMSERMATMDAGGGNPTPGDGYNAPARSPKPVIAAINGFCYGGATRLSIRAARAGCRRRRRARGRAAARGRRARRCPGFHAGVVEHESAGGFRQTAGHGDVVVLVSRLCRRRARRLRAQRRRQTDGCGERQSGRHSVHRAASL